MSNAAATDQIEADLARNRQSLRYLDQRAGEYADRSLQMRQLATAITIELLPLRTAFDQIRRLHTTHTWQGEAATASRLRLDILESRHAMALRQLDQLVDDLDLQASISQQNELDIIAQMSSVRWAIDQLELELTAA